MTDSTDNARGPERIWLDPEYLIACNLGTSNPKRSLDGDVGYIRADLAAPSPDVLALVDIVGKSLDAIDDLNTLPPDENGHKWRASDLLDQEVMALRAAIARITDTGGRKDG